MITSKFTLAPMCITPAFIFTVDLEAFQTFLFQHSLSCSFYIVLASVTVFLKIFFYGLLISSLKALL